MDAAGSHSTEETRGRPHVPAWLSEEQGVSESSRAPSYGSSSPRLPPPGVQSLLGPEEPLLDILRERHPISLDEQADTNAHRSESQVNPNGVAALEPPQADRYDNSAEVEDDEAAECRICRGLAENDRPLFFPCKCAGSIKYIHEDCLVRWLGHSGSGECELCGHPIRFEPLYKDDAPADLPVSELLLGILHRTHQTARAVGRLFLVLFVWLFCLPLGTSWIFHSLFVQSFSELANVFASKGFVEISSDVLLGSMLSVSIVFMFLGVSSLREYFRIAREERQLFEGEAIEGVGHDFDEDSATLSDDDHSVDLPLEVDGPHQMQAVANENDGGAFLGLFDFDVEEVPLDEVIGQQGPLRNLFDNAATFLVSNGIFLLVFALFPLFIGRSVLIVLTLGVGVVVEVLLPPNFFERYGEVCPSADFEDPVLLQSKIFSQMGETCFFDLNTMTERGGSITGMNAPLQYWLPDEVGDFLTIIIGYCAVACSAVAYVAGTRILRAWFTYPVSPTAQQLIAFLRYFATFIKVVVLLVFEYGIFPFAIGVWLDLCTLPFFGCSADDRVEFFTTTPWISISIHWLIGIGYLINFSEFVSLLREILRPELLSFFQNPEDPDFHPLKEIIERPLSSHARRMTLSAMVYAPLIVAFVHVPAKLCVLAFAAQFPFRLPLNDPLADSALYLTLIYAWVVLGGYAQFVNPRRLLRRFLQAWIGLVSKAFGVSKLVIKREGSGIVRHDLGVLTEDIEETNVESKLVLRLKATCILLLAWLTIVFIDCVATTGLTMIGRVLLNMGFVSVKHDLCAFALGLFTVAGLAEAAMQAWHFLRDHDLLSALRLCADWLLCGVKIYLMSLFVAGFIAGALGMLLDLVFLVPLRVSFDETPMPMKRDQQIMIGFVFLKAWGRLVLVGTYETPWKAKLERIREAGLDAMTNRFAETFLDVLLPVFSRLVLALCLPYVFCMGLLRLIGLVDYSTALKLCRLSYTALACLSCYSMARHYIEEIVRYLHDAVRDDRYLVGRRLYNFSIEDPQSNKT